MFFYTFKAKQLSNSFTAFVFTNVKFMCVCFFEFSFSYNFNTYHSKKLYAIWTEKKNIQIRTSDLEKKEQIKQTNNREILTFHEFNRIINKYTITKIQMKIK